MTYSFSRKQTYRLLAKMESDEAFGEFPAIVRRNIDAELRSLDREIERLRGLFEPAPVAGGDRGRRKRKQGGEFSSPPKTPLERVATALTEKGIQIRDEGSGGIPEMMAQEFAGMLAGVSHHDVSLIRTADALFWTGLVGDQRRRPDLISELHQWGCNRFMLRFPGVSLSGQHHGRIVRAVVERVADGHHRSARELQSACSIGSKRWPDLAPHVAALIGRCQEAESLLAEHLRRQ